MITRSEAAVESLTLHNAADSSWQRQLAEAITEPAELLSRLQLPLDHLQAAQAASRVFPLRVPEAFLKRINVGDLQDPLLRQVLPLADELQVIPGYLTDPLAEQNATPTRGVIHKYQGRLLLILSGGCAINCRYCFRRHFPYADNQLSGEQWTQALDYIAADDQLSEIILSGGDPLATPDGRFSRMLDGLEDIAHLKRLRIHSRLPVVLPDRITDALCARLAQSRLRPILVLHINHAQEIDAAVIQACQQLQDAGVRLYNQSVLLRGVNDSVAALATLNEQLFELGVQPYYLHLLDPVAGAAHFDCDEQQARRLLGQLACVLPGYMMPQLVREQPGFGAKTRIPPLLP